MTLTVTPRFLNKHLHDTYLRQGALRVVARCDGVSDGLDRACAALASKLHRMTPPPPRRRNLRRVPPPASRSAA